MTALAPLCLDRSALSVADIVAKANALVSTCCIDSRNTLTKRGRVVSKYQAKTKVTAASVTDFINAIENDTRRADAKALVKIFKEATGWKPRMWGAAIVGFGAYHYTYESGHSGSICAVGFSPRKANLVIYSASFPGLPDLLEKLGKHRGGIQQCLYINKLADVHAEVLKEILKKSLVELRTRWPVTAS